jgi:hypothetical protein
VIAELGSRCGGFDKGLDFIMRLCVVSRVLGCCDGLDNRLDFVKHFAMMSSVQGLVVSIGDNGREDVKCLKRGFEESLQIRVRLEDFDTGKHVEGEMIGISF